MLTFRRLHLRRWYGLIAALLIAGCADGTAPKREATTDVLAVIQCTGSRTAIRCEPGIIPAGVSASIQPTLNRIVGGQNLYVKLTSTGTSFNSTTNPAFVAPVLEYPHTEGCSITGGFVYRSSAIPWLTGQYLFSDYCTGFLRSISGDPIAGFSEQRWTIPSIGNVLSFGEDAAGEMYVLTDGGVVYRIIEK